MKRPSAAVRAGAARVVEHHEGEQAGDLRIVGDGGELPGEPDDLLREVDVAGIALVEHQVQDAQHGRDVARLIEPQVGDRALGAADALRHRRLGHQVGPSNLTCRQSAHRPQGERNRGRRRQRRVRAEEVERQGVVRGHGRARRGFLLDEALPPAAGCLGTDRVEEPAPGHVDDHEARDQVLGLGDRISSDVHFSIGTSFGGVGAPR